MIDDIQPRQGFQAFVVESDGYTVTLCNVRSENGEFLPGEIEKRGKVFADVKTGDHITFRTRLGIGKGGIDTLGVINCVCVSPRLYNPQTDMMNPRQMYKQIEFWAQRNPISKRKGGELHHLIPLNQLIKHKYKDEGKFHVMVSTWLHYMLHRLYARWKNTLINWTTTKGFLWKPGASIEEGNADYMDGMDASKLYLFRRLRIPIEQYDDFLFLFVVVLKNDESYFSQRHRREHDFHAWMKTQDAALQQLKSCNVDITGIMHELGGIGRMIQWKIEDLVRELLTQLLNQNPLVDIKITRRKLMNELRRSTSFLINFRNMISRIYTEVRHDLQLNDRTPAKCPWSIAQILRDFAPPDG